MNRLGVVIADGVGYRNFVLSDFIKETAIVFDEIIIYSGVISQIYDNTCFNNVIIKEIDIYNENKISFFWRKLKEITHLQLYRNFFGIKTSLQNGKPRQLNSLRNILISFIYKFSYLFHSEKLINFYESLQLYSLEKDEIFKKYVEIFKKDKVSHLFFTHQRPANLAPVLHAANKCGISTSTFIFSWDNLASKGRMLGTFDYHIVWSTLMKTELMHFYPRTPKETIKIVGTPQFEPYVLDSYSCEKNDFFRKFNLNQSLKTICYSCGDVSTSKLDPLYIETIAEGIINNKINDSVNFLVRTSPAEDGTRFQEIKNKYPFILWNLPKWKLTRSNHTEIWSQRVPTEEDLIDLKSILSFCDVNVNMCSTMSLDFMLFDKPVINAVFGSESNDLYNDQKYLNYDHYKKVVESGAVAIVKNEEQLFKALNHSLANPLARLPQQKELLKLQISKPLKGTSKRIALQLKEWSES